MFEKALNTEYRIIIVLYQKSLTGFDGYGLF